MRRLVGDNTTVSFYDPAVYNQLSQETRDYVPSVLAAAWLFLHPESYNLRFPRVDKASKAEFAKVRQALESEGATAKKRAAKTVKTKTAAVKTNDFRRRRARSRHTASRNRSTL